LAAQVLNGLIGRHDLDPLEIEDVQMGCVTQIGEQGWNVGRMAVMAAGWPVEVSATTVDRQCGSSMQTNFNAAAAVMAGQPDGVVTAGNSSQIVDGSAAVLIASEAAVGRLGLRPRARFVSFGLAGVDPTRMLHGNPQAMEKALAKAGLTMDDTDVIEVNEA